MKRILLLLFYISNIVLSYSQEVISKNLDSIYIDSNISYHDVVLTIKNGWLPPLKKELFYLSLGNLSKDDLRILRNTIYAQYGMIFSSNSLSSHFEKYDWYKPLLQNIDSRLSLVDKKNISYIQIFEKSIPNNDIANSDLIGHWEVGFPVASGSYYPITFYNDGVFEIGYNAMVPKKVISTKGTWFVRNGFLELKIESDLNRVGGYYVGAYASFAGNYAMEEVRYVNMQYKEPILMKIPIGIIENVIINNNSMKRISIGGWNYIKFPE